MFHKNGELKIHKISEVMARYLFNTDKAVYRLYDDGTEAEIEENLEISKHAACDGIFGVEE